MRSMVEGDSSEFMPPPPPTQPSLRKLACDGRFPSPLRGRIIRAMNRVGAISAVVFVNRNAT